MIIPGIIFWLAVFSAIVDPFVGLWLLTISLITATIQFAFQWRGSKDARRVMASAHKQG